MRPAESRPAAAAMLAAASLLVASCSSSADSDAAGTDATGPQVLERDGVTTLVLGSDLDGAGDALIEGSLTLTESGCLAVQDPSGVESVLAWPTGVELLTGDDTRIRVPNVGDIIVGDEFSAGGEYHAPPWGDKLQMPDVPDRCLDTADDEIAMIQQEPSIDL